MAHKSLTLMLAVTLSIAAAANTWGGLELDHATVRVDQYPVPVEDWSWMEAWGMYCQYFPDYFKKGATIHCFVRNTGTEAIDISELHLDGKTIEEVTTVPEALRPVIWHRINPETIEAGQSAMVYIRLRDVPTTPLRVTVSPSEGPAVETTLGPGDAERIRLAYVGFNAGMNRLYTYVEPLADGPLTVDKVFLDGKEVTAASHVLNETFVGGRVALVETVLADPPAYGSFHVLKVTTQQGPIAAHQVRVHDGKFLLGMVGGNKPKCHQKFFNMSYNLHGAHPDKPGWWDPESEDARLDYVTLTPGPTEAVAAAGATVPPGHIIYGNVDEPDAHEPGPGAYMERCGINIMRQVEPAMRFQRRLDPHHLTAVLIDRTYAPRNWLDYGEVPDLPFHDIYVPTQWHGYSMGVFAPTMDAFLAATAPRPTHIMLFGCINTGHMVRRAPTPEENDLSVHYVIGCGGKGIHYFLDWNSYPTVFEGGYYISALRTGMLWKNMGRMNAELTRLAPLLSIGHSFDAVEVDNPDIWARSLLCGPDSLVVVLVNDTYQEYPNVPNLGGAGYQLYPTGPATVSLDLPPWLTGARAYDVSWDGVTPVSMTDGTIAIESLATSKVLVISKDPDITQTLALDPDRLRALRESEIPRYSTSNDPIPDRRNPNAVIAIDDAAFAAGRYVLDLTREQTLANAVSVATTGRLCLEPGEWLGLFPPDGKAGESKLVFTLQTPEPPKKVTAALVSETLNLAACARNVIGISTNGINYARTDTYHLKTWNGGASGERLAATTETGDATTFTISVTMRDPGLVSTDEPTSIARKVVVTWEQP